jgi:hypothetical protein
MLDDMRRAYVEAGGPSFGVFIGKLLGMIARTAAQTAVVVMVLRLLGVL